MSFVSSSGGVFHFHSIIRFCSPESIDPSHAADGKGQIYNLVKYQMEMKDKNDPYLKGFIFTCHFDMIFVCCLCPFFEQMKK